MRLIDADALTLCNYDLPSMFSFRAVPEEILENAPTIDTVEQKHGHWIEIKDDRFLCWECSCCGSRFGIYFENYCSTCGAKMDEVTE